MGGVVKATRAWIEQPFNSQMSLLYWFLFVGALLASSYLWSRVIAHIKGAG